MPRIPLAEPDLNGNEARYLAACVEDNWVSSAGPFVTEMERRVAALTGRAHAIATVNGTAALHIGLAARGIGAGDLVAIPDWTFAATANAVVHAGAEPVFLDVSAADWALDPAALEAACAVHGERLRAVIVVDPLGNLPDPAPFRQLAARQGMYLLEDAAAAIGATRNGEPAGRLGDAATFSFNGNKTVTAGGGGMLVTDDAGLADRMRHLTTQARCGQEYRHDAIGFNYRMTNVNAAIGLAQLERLDDMLTAKRAIAGRYREALADRSDLAFMPLERLADSPCWLSSVVVASEASTHDLIAHLDGRGIDARPFWRSLSEQPPYAGFRRGEVVVSRRLSGRVVSLPSSSHLSAADQDRVLEALRTWQGPALEAAA